MKKETKRFEPNELVWYYDDDNFARQATVIATQDYRADCDWYYVVLAGGDMAGSEPFSMQSHQVFRTIQESDCDKMVELSRKVTYAIESFVRLAQKTNVFTDLAGTPAHPKESNSMSTSKEEE